MELAKIQEHRLKDLPAAYMLVSEAIGMASRGLARTGPSANETSAESLALRAARLEEKLRRARG